MLDLVTLIFLGIVFYCLFGMLGALINIAICAPDKNKNGWLFSGRVIQWTKNNKRLSKEAQWFLLGMGLILWLPLLIINLLFLIVLSIKVTIKGLANIIWVITTDKIAKKTKIEASQFDEWRTQVENFIESIPSSTGATKCET